MTATDPVPDLFAQLQPPHQGMRWLAEQLLSAAMEQYAVAFEAVPTSPDKRVLVYLGEQPLRLKQFPVSLFRNLLAQFSGIASAETGSHKNPYGDRFQLVRSGKNGPVELNVDFTNTPAIQRLFIVATTPSSTKE